MNVTKNPPFGNENTQNQNSRLEAGTGRSWVCAEWRVAGKDVIILVTGGTAPHIGAVATAFMQGGDVSASVISVPGHKEAELALEFAEDICRTTGRTVLVSCGIHIDHALPEEIALLCENARKLKKRLAGSV